MKANMIQDPQKLACHQCRMDTWHILFRARYTDSRCKGNGGGPREGWGIFLRCLGCGHVTPAPSENDP